MSRIDGRLLRMSPYPRKIVAVSRLALGRKRRTMVGSLIVVGKMAGMMGMKGTVGV